LKDLNDSIHCSETKITDAGKKLKGSVNKVSLWKRQLEEDNYPHFIRIKELFSRASIGGRNLPKSFQRSGFDQLDNLG
jgi:hypothetical protein